MREVGGWCSDTDGRMLKLICRSQNIRTLLPRIKQSRGSSVCLRLSARVFLKSLFVSGSLCCGLGGATWMEGVGGSKASWEFSSY